MGVFIERRVSYEDERTIESFVRKVLHASRDVQTCLNDPDFNRRVLVKPNWIQAGNVGAPDEWDALITNPAVIIATINETARLLGGEGKVVVADAPQTDANFEAIMRRGEFGARVEEVRRKWPSIEIEVLDLRREVWTVRGGVVVERLRNVEDPRGYVRLDLGTHSLLHGHQGEGRYYGADYDAEELNSHHKGEKHEYLLSGTAVDCGLFINLPKLKTHKKTGITCCLKNLVGINGDKNWLPHHTMGTPETGGDEYPAATVARSAEAEAKRFGQRLALRIPLIGPFAYSKARALGLSLFGKSSVSIRNGNWEGNDTCWRMALDLNRALLFGARDGGLVRPHQGRKPCVAIVDAIVAGEGDGPAAPSRRVASALVGGTGFAEVDAVCARLVGYSLERVPVVGRAFDQHAMPIAENEIDNIVVEDGGRKKSIHEVEPFGTPFVPHFGWPSLA